MKLKSLQEEYFHSLFSKTVLWLDLFIILYQQDTRLILYGFDERNQLEELELN